MTDPTQVAIHRGSTLIDRNHELFLARERISDLEAIVRQQKSMLDEIAEAAGFDLADTYSAASIISGLKDPRFRMTW